MASRKLDLSLEFRGEAQFGDVIVGSSADGFISKPWNHMRSPVDEEGESAPRAEHL